MHQFLLIQQKAGPFYAVSLLAKVANTIKFSVTSSENKEVTLLKIYLVNVPFLLVFDFYNKNISLICSMKLEKTKLKTLSTIYSDNVFHMYHHILVNL